jgi:hypothetical protein
MKYPFAEILCSPEAATDIRLKQAGWVRTKAGFAFENWVLKDEPKNKKVLNLKGREDVISVTIHNKL